MSKLKPQINPKLFIAALSTGAALVLSAATSAGHAQGGFTIKKNQLEQVTPYKARQRVDIIDETPIVTDHRKRSEAGPIYQIEIPPLTAGPAGSVIKISPTSNNLQPAGFGSNISPNSGAGRNRNLPAVEQGHLGKQMAAEAKAMKATSARPIGKPSNTIAPAQIKSVTAPASYSNYKAVGNSGSAGSMQKTTTDATGVIKKRDLLLK